MSAYVAWDIEIVKTPTSPDWKKDRPLGISCAATRDNRGLGKIFYGGYTDPHEEIQPKMSVDDCTSMVFYLKHLLGRNFKIITWNGLGFDWNILAEESKLLEICRDIALQHYDPMFQFLCYMGYPVSLQAVANGLNIEGKTPGVDGKEAPAMWRNGQYGEVLQYVCQDVRVTLQIAMLIEEFREVRWITKSGRLGSCIFPNGLMTVEECLKIYPPNTEWMNNPLPRNIFTDWMELDL